MAMYGQHTTGHKRVTVLHRMLVLLQRGVQDQLAEAAKANFHCENIGVLQHRPWKAHMVVKLNLISFVDSPTRFAHFCSAVHLVCAPFCSPSGVFGRQLRSFEASAHQSNSRESGWIRSVFCQSVHAWISTSQLIRCSSPH